MASESRFFKCEWISRSKCELIIFIRNQTATAILSQILKYRVLSQEAVTGQAHELVRFWKFLNILPLFVFCHLRNFLTLSDVIIRIQWCWWQSYIGDFMILFFFFKTWPTSQIGHQQPAISTTNIDVYHQNTGWLLSVIRCYNFPKFFNSWVRWPEAAKALNDDSRATHHGQPSRPDLGCKLNQTASMEEGADSRRTSGCSIFIAEYFHSITEFFTELSNRRYNFFNIFICLQFTFFWYHNFKINRRNDDSSAMGKR